MSCNELYTILHIKRKLQAFGNIHEKYYKCLALPRYQDYESIMNRTLSKFKLTVYMKKITINYIYSSQIQSCIGYKSSGYVLLIIRNVGLALVSSFSIIIYHLWNFDHNYACQLQNVTY